MFKTDSFWYIYSPTGNNAAQGMIETNVIFHLPKGITRKGKMQLPETTFKGGFEVYHGEGIVFTQQFTVADDLTPGEYTIKARVLYQACNEAICLPPITDEAEITVVVNGAASRADKAKSTSQAIVPAKLCYW